ncbi:MAG: VWA domain-containing protein, partial [Planctomycetota bacterium]
MINNRRAALVPMVAILLPVLIIIAAYAINLAAIELRNTEMYVAADSAARAGSRIMALRDQNAAIDTAKQFAGLNRVAGQPLTLSNSDIEFGTAERQGSGRHVFQPGGSFPNAIRITANRSQQSADGPIPLFMPGILGLDEIEMTQRSVASQISVDIGLVIDRSGSMAYAANEVAQHPPNPAAAPEDWEFCDPVPPQSRWLDVVNAVGVFFGELNSSGTDELVSITTYNDNAVVDQSLTREFAQAQSRLNIYSQSFCSGGTNIGGGIVRAINSMSSDPNARSGAVKVLVVLTDGIHNGGTDPVNAANQAGSQGALIFSVTFSNEAEQNRMRQVANVGNGKHFHANNGNDLKQVFQEIAKSLPTLIV